VIPTNQLNPRFWQFSSKMSVKVTSYNVLSSHLSAASYFTACQPEYCDPQYRFQLIQAKLDQEIASNAVICLQEVSTSWACHLHPYFIHHGYHFITGLYGNRYDGYMGVGMAIPLSKYDIEDVDISNIADTKRMPRKAKVDSFFGKVWSTLNNWFWKLAEMVRLYKPPIDVWDNALYRRNQMICTRLRCKETKRAFVVGTYHMPCMFKLPAVMHIHCALSAQHIQRFAKHDPFLFVGDFNIKPESSQYELLTKGKLEKNVSRFYNALRQLICHIYTCFIAS
jgi:mRNA deadenylase 3'-5' endonuclease subunit Ccr4